jgi:hypothetical protein
MANPPLMRCSIWGAKKRPRFRVTFFEIFEFLAASFDAERHKRGPEER